MEDPLLVPDVHPQSGFQPTGWGMGCSYYYHPRGCWEEFDPDTYVHAPSQCWQLILCWPLAGKVLAEADPFISWLMKLPVICSALTTA